MVWNFLHYIAKGKSHREGFSSKNNLYFQLNNHYIIPSCTQKRKGRPKKEEVEVEKGGSERESEGEEEEPPPKRKKRAIKTKAADVEEGSGHEEMKEATSIAPPPAKKKKKATVAAGEGDGKKAHISQKRPANTKGQAKDKMAASESIPAVVYYPKKLGYANGEDTTSNSGESEVSEEEEEEWKPAGQKVRRC